MVLQRSPFVSGNGRGDGVRSSVGYGFVSALGLYFMVASLV